MDMKQILTTLSLALCLSTSSFSAQGAPIASSACIEFLQELKKEHSMMSAEMRRWPRWLRRLLNGRGNGERPSGGRGRR